MKVFVVGYAPQGIIQKFYEHNDDFFYGESIDLLTIPIPYDGYILYDGKKIFIDEYDAVIDINNDATSQYLYTLLKSHCCFIGAPRIRVNMSDKVMAAIIMSNHGLPVVKTAFSFGEADISGLNTDCGYIVKKPKNRSLGYGVERLTPPFDTKEPDRIYQEYIECNCSDERWIIVDGELVCAEKRTSNSPNEFRSNLHLGGIGEKIELTDEMRELSKKIYECFPEAIYLGADILRSTDGRIFVGEVNADPNTGIIGISGHNFYVDIYNYIVKRVNTWKSSKNTFKELINKV